MLIACYRGCHASGGTRGVGTATTQAMVQAAFSVFVLDCVVGVLLH